MSFLPADSTIVQTRQKHSKSIHFYRDRVLVRPEDARLGVHILYIGVRSLSTRVHWGANTLCFLGQRPVLYSVYNPTCAVSPTRLQTMQGP